MIANKSEYEGALDELRQMEAFLAELMNEPLNQPDLSRLSVRRMIIRLHEEIGAYEAYIERPPHLKPPRKTRLKSDGKRRARNAATRQEVKS